MENIENKEKSEVEVSNNTSKQGQESDPLPLAYRRTVKTYVMRSGRMTGEAGRQAGTTGHVRHRRNPLPSPASLSRQNRQW